VIYKKLPVTVHKFLPQFTFQDLARRALGKFVQNDIFLRDLKGGKASLQKSLQLLGNDLLPRLGSDESSDTLTPLSIRNPDHRASFPSFLV